MGVPHRVIEDPKRLHALIDAMLLIGHPATLDELLQQIVDTAADLVGVRYAALGVIDAHGTGLRAFITHGVTQAEREAIGPLPSGQGLLGRVIEERHTIRVDDLTTAEGRSGFPPNHPPMRRFLGAPVLVGTDKVFGNLYLCDRFDGEPFTAEDEALVDALGVAAGLVISDARLRAHLQDATLAAERARLARDLHDTVIQRLFAVGLGLQALSAAQLSDSSREQLQSAIDELDTTIREIRTTIFEISDRRNEDAGGLRSELRAIVDEATSRLGLRVAVEFDGAIDTGVSKEAADHVVHVVRELLSNVVRHANASRAMLTVSLEDGVLCIVVADDGRGPASFGPEGHGLGNLRARAKALGGDVEVDGREGGGTVVTWTARRLT